MRPVVCPQIRETEALHTWTGELRLGMNHGNLLVERHPAQCIIDTLLDGFALIEIDWRLRR